MNDDWAEIEEIFHAALDLPAADRDAFIAARCPDDPGRRSEIHSLIDEHESGSDFLSEPVFDAGLKALERKLENSLAGTTIGPYRIESKVGAGGMGEVYRAVDTRLDRTVALKFLSDSLENDGRARRQLAKEARAAAALDHPNICSVFGLENIDDHQFIAMQYIDGVTLDEHLGGEPLPIDEFRSIAKQIVSAVAFAHSHGIIHRDLKPGNIMVASDGSVKVLDFGLAKVVSPLGEGVGAEPSRMSTEGLIIGTVSYMSPEQLRGEKLDFRSDIFSLGIILCEMLTGKNPFARPTQAETIAAILGGTATVEKQLREANIYSAIGNSLHLVLMPLRSDRNASAADLLLRLGESRTVLFSLLSHRLIFVILTALLVIAVFTATFLYRTSVSSRRVIVLPFNSSGVTTENEFLVQGISRDMIEKLARGDKIRVANESTLESLVGRDFEPALVAKEFGADLYVSGTVTQSNDHTKVSVQLARSRDQLLIDTFEMEADPANLSNTTDRIVRRLLEKIVPGISADEENRATKPDTLDPEAKRAYLTGRLYLSTRKGRDLVSAEKSFRTAISLDPGYAKAWAGLSDTFVQYSVPGNGKSMKPSEAFNAAREAAQKAIDFDDTLAEPYNALGSVKLEYEWNWTDAEQLFRSAIARDPDFPSPHLNLASVYTITGKYDSAIDEAKIAKQLSPLSLSVDLNLIRIYYFKRDWTTMKQLLDRSKETYPDHPRLRYFDGLRDLATGQTEAAVKIFEEIYEKEPTLGAAPLGFAYAKSGRRSEANRILNNFTNLSKENGYVPAQELAIVYAGLGDFNSAFDRLTSACQETFPRFPFLLSDPLIDDLRSDRRFPQLVACAKL